MAEAQRVIITGGSGTIGRALVRVLTAQGREVVVLSRNPDRTRDHVPATVRLARWDAHSGDGWFDLINEDTAIVNLAGQNPANWRWTAAHKRRVMASRIAAGEAVVDAVRRADRAPNALMQASAVGYYGNRGSERLTETSTPGEGFRADVCKVWERVTRSLSDPPYNVRQCWLRIGIVLTMESGAFPPFVAAAYLFGRQLGDGRQYVPWLHLDDCARMIAFLIDDDTTHGAVNLCAPQPATNRALMHTLSGVVGLPDMIPVPGWALRLALGEQAGTVLDSQRVVPQRLLDAGYNFAHPDLEPALRDLLNAGS